MMDFHNFDRTALLDSVTALGLTTGTGGDGMEAVPTEVLTDTQTLTGNGGTK